MNALVTVEPNNVEVYRTSTEAAHLCREIVLASATTIQGRKYVCVEGWQAIAIAHGCTASARDVERINGGVRAIGEIRRMSDGKVIAEAEGFVGEDEPTWYGGEVTSYGKTKTLPKRADYAIRAMAQTRAISRACRSAFAHVVVMMNAGLSTTPAEEVPYGGFEDDHQAAPPPRPSARQAITETAREVRDEPESDGPSPIFTACKAAIDLCEDEGALIDWKAKNVRAFEQMGDDDYNAVGAYWKARVKAVRAAAKTQPQPTTQPADDFGLNGDEIPDFN